MDNSWVVIVSSVSAVAVVIGFVVAVVLFVRRRIAYVSENVQPYNFYGVDPLENDALLTTAESVNVIRDRISSRHSY